MSLGIFIKLLRSSLLQKSLFRSLEMASNKNLVILTYHRVLPQNKITDQIEPGMYVTPATLQKHILFLKKYFQIISIAQLENISTDTDQDENHKPFCLITFDDGWLDFYEYAWPILSQENVPAVVYLPTKIIGTCRMFWTDRLALILTNGGLGALTEIIDDVGLKKSLNTRKSQVKFDILIQRFKQFSYSQIESLLDDCMTKMGLSESGDRSFMNWDEVRELYGSGLISFGSHTVNHAILTTLSRSEIADELLLSRQKLIDEQVVGKNIPFCYPNGDYTMDMTSMVKESGYSSAVTCVPGWNGKNNDLFSLKRISLHQDISSTDSLLAYRLAQYL